MPTPDFTIASTPSSVSLVNGGAAQAITVTVSAVNSFSGSVSVSLSGLPTGVTATPATLSISPGQLGQFMLSASGATVASAIPLTVTGTSAGVSHTSSASLAVMAAPPPADFAIVSTPSTLSLVNGGPAQLMTVTVSSMNSFTDSVTISLGGLPMGVTANPASVSIAPGQLGQFMLSASGAAVSTSVPITLNGTSGSLSHTTPATLAIAAAPPIASLSNLTFDFGQDLVGTTITNSVVTVTNSGGSDLGLSPTLSGDTSFAIASTGSCGATLAAGSSCTEVVNYKPTTASGASPQTAMLHLGFTNAPAGTPQTVVLTGTSAALTAGTISKTQNPQVALYSIKLPFPGSISVNFGPDTSYGRSTWWQSTDTAGGTINMLVAGMLPNATYHMQAVIQLSNGATATDSDHTFQTGAPLVVPNLTVTTTPGMTPQPGVEQLTLLASPIRGIAVTDLQGGVLWTYASPNPTIDDIEGVKQLPNGHFLITIGDGSGFAGTATANNIIAIREIDLTGGIVREISIDDLNTELVAAGYNLALRQFHHDVTPLPNGHWLVLSNTLKTYTNVTGFPGTSNVLGDVIVDLDENLQPVWVWNEFDHLDVNRHPLAFPDWTHTNAVIYSPSDGNIMVSMRSQNWVIKVAYNDGAGNGDVLWRLGAGGDFTLVGGTDPVDWQYAQHYPSLFTPNSSGVFSLGLMDNGNARVFPPFGCGGAVLPPCNYSSIPVFQIDEGAKTATFTFHQKLPAALYSFFGGNTDLLANGNVEYDLCGVGAVVGAGSDIFEVTQTSTPQTVWHMHSTGASVYRGYRMPSLYPGVQW
jgi:arylsulfate sulfotransferase